MPERPVSGRYDDAAVAGLVAEAVARRLQSQLDRLEARLEVLVAASPSGAVRSLRSGHGHSEVEQPTTAPDAAWALHQHRSKSSFALEMELTLVPKEGCPEAAGFSGNGIDDLQDGRGGDGDAAEAASGHDDVLGERPGRGPLGNVDCFVRFVDSKLFSLLSLASVGLFFLVYGSLMDFTAAIWPNMTPPVSEYPWLFYASPVLPFGVTLEVAFQLLAHGTAAATRDSFWFWIDVAGMLGLWWDVLAMLQLVPWYMITMVPRVLRALKLFRILTISSELNFIMTCVLKSISTFCWAILLLGFSLMVAAFFVMQWVTNFIVDDPTHPHVEKLLEIFPSMRETIFLLLQSVTGATSWLEAYNVLSIVGTIPPFSLCAFVIFIQLSAFNVVTSIFVNKSLEVAEARREEVS